jgi:leucine dehydrogenase
MSQIFEQINQYPLGGHEQVVFCSDQSCGLKAIIAIYDTTLGPAEGGTRMLPYKSEEEALEDVLKLSCAMAYKCSAAGIDFGGGKAVIIGDPERDKSEALFRSLGEFVERLNGRYIIAEDVGTCVDDLVMISKSTKWVGSLPLSMGGSGDSSENTALGVVSGMRACANEVFGADSLMDKKIAIQGMGHCGYEAAKILHTEGAKLFVTDINSKNISRAVEEFDAVFVPDSEIFDLKCDIFAPFALGGILNSETIPRLKCEIVAGSANNQLKNKDDAWLLMNKNILYAPDYIVNAGGVINVFTEFDEGGYTLNKAQFRAKKIYDKMKQVIDMSKEKKISTVLAADTIAESGILNARKSENSEVNHFKRKP